MAKAWIIIRGWGEYSDRGTIPVRVYLDCERAQADMANLDVIYRKYQMVIQPKGSRMVDYRAAESISSQITAEYAAVGFDAGWTDDWELAEADLAE